MFDWDAENIRHIARHGITPQEVEEVLKRFPIDLEYQEYDGEERIMQIGVTSTGRLLVIVTTMISGTIRVVTAFPATEKQRAAYVEASGFTHD
jgi:uncharacterized DUF497 family protein